MKIIVLIVLTFAIIFPNITCKSNKKYTPDQYSDERLVFGSGGGFAGTYTEFCILKNGQFFGRQTTSKEWQPLESIPVLQVRQYFAQIDELNLRNVVFNSPGNWSYYISIQNQNEKPHKIQWCAESTPKDQRIMKFYEILENHTKDLPPFKANNPVR